MRKRLTALAAAVLLSACGGGGGSGDIDVRVDYDPGAAWRQLLTTPRNYTAAGRGSDGRDYVYTLSFTPQGSGSYPRNGASAERVERRSSLTPFGGPPAIDLGALFFITGFLLIGLSSASGGCSDIGMPFAPPPFSPIGGSGSLFGSTDYASCTPGGSSNGNSTTRWTIQFYSGDVYFCLDTTQRDSGGAVSLTQSICFALSPAGNGLGSKLQYTLVIPGQNFSLVARGG